MWLVVHMTYAQRVRLDGAPLEADAFKPSPQGHTDGSLKRVPAYVGYLAANVLTGQTRGWVMGQGHCVAAIEAVNVTHNPAPRLRSEEHTSELQSRENLVCRLLLENKKRLKRA